MGQRFSTEFVEELRIRLPISEVVGRSVSLKRSGKALMALCPFHSEKTPSFSVNDAKNIFHCFGCGVGGDVFKYLMLLERLSFPEAVERLAGYAGVALPAAGPGGGAEPTRGLKELNELAASFYREELRSPRGAKARAYLAGRGVTAETSEQFELGLAPEGWDGLARAMKARGIKEEDLVAAGLCAERGRGHGVYDRFRARIMFPIRTAGGSLVAFGGRALGSDGPKYLNSPETRLYSKGDCLYGLDRAQEPVRRAGRCLVVEGYMDCIMLHQAGFAETVATLGTSLTQGHARLIKRNAGRVLMCYDADPAGLRAVERALEVFLPAGLEVAVVCLPEGVDPDDYVRAEGPEALGRQLESAKGFVDFLAGASVASEPEERIRLGRRVLGYLARIEDGVARRVHTARLAERLSLEDEVLLAELGRSLKRGAPAPPSEPVRPAGSPVEKLLVAALFSDEPWVEELAGEIAPEWLEQLRLRATIEHALARRASGLKPLANVELEQGVGAEEFSLVTRLLAEADPLERREVASAVARLREQSLQRRLAILQARLKQGQLSDADLLEKHRLAMELQRCAAGLGPGSPA